MADETTERGLLAPDELNQQVGKTRSTKKQVKEIPGLGFRRKGLEGLGFRALSPYVELGALRHPESFLWYKGLRPGRRP